jgi:hypothetical protein
LLATPSDQRVAAITSGFSLPACHFQLFTSGFSFLASHSNCFALCLKRRTSSVSSPSLQEDSYRKAANEFEDDLIDNRVRKNRKGAERSNGISTKDCNDLAKTSTAAQLVTDSRACIHYTYLLLTLLDKSTKSAAYTSAPPGPTRTNYTDNGSTSNSVGALLVCEHSPSQMPLLPQFPWAWGGRTPKRHAERTADCYRWWTILPNPVPRRRIRERKSKHSRGLIKERGILP